MQSSIAAATRIRRSSTADTWNFSWCVRSPPASELLNFFAMSAPCVEVSLAKGRHGRTDLEVPRSHLSPRPTRAGHRTPDLREADDPLCWTCVDDRSRDTCDPTDPNFTLHDRTTANHLSDVRERVSLPSEAPEVGAVNLRTVEQSSDGNRSRVELIVDACVVL